MQADKVYQMEDGKGADSRCSSHAASELPAQLGSRPSKSLPQLQMHPIVSISATAGREQAGKAASSPAAGGTQAVRLDDQSSPRNSDHQGCDQDTCTSSVAATVVVSQSNSGNSWGGATEVVLDQADPGREVQHMNTLTLKLQQLYLPLLLA